MPDDREDELTSWKEIASFLGIAVRTAQLWERERNLPVRRLPGGRGRVLASAAELGRWKASATAAPAPAVPEQTVRRPLRWSGRARIGAILAGLLAITTILTGIGARFTRPTPFAAKVEAHSLILLDNEGRELWRRTFSQSLVESDHPELQATSTWIGDLDDDGHTEVLFSPHPCGRPAKSGELICYDDRGRVRWTYRNSRTVRTAGEQFSAVYGAAGFLVVRLGKGRRNAVLLSTTHELYFPSSTVLLSPSGATLREYWHSGHLNHLQAADLNGDGKPKFYLAGINNARHAATVVVLDEDHFSGAAREPGSTHHQLLDFPPGVEVARFLIPQTCLSRTFDPYNPVTRFFVNEQGLLVETAERIGPGAGVYHHLSPDLRPQQTDISDAYRVEHRRAVLDRYITESSCPLEPIPEVEFVGR
jgi:hypothetical protein